MTMTLAEKGHYAPPPKLPRFAQQVSERVGQWPRVQARTHWFLGDESVVDGADFYLGDEELGHLHLDAEAHIAQVATVRDALVKAKLAHPFRYSRDFVTAPVERASDVDHVAWLFELRRRQLEGVPVDALVKEIQAVSAAKRPTTGRAPRL